MSAHKLYSFKVIMVLLTALAIVMAWQSWYLMGVQQKIDQLQIIDADTGQQYQLSQLNTNTILPQHADTTVDKSSATAVHPEQWHPLTEIQQMHKQMNSFFNNAFARFELDSDSMPRDDPGSIANDLKIREEADKFIVSVDIPGLDINNVNISHDEHSLTIRGATEQNKELTDAQGRIVAKKHYYSELQRSITLPAPLKAEGMSSRIEQGILTITLLKK